MCSVALGVLFLFAVFLFGIVTAAGLRTGPIPVHSCGPLPMAAICMHQLVNLPVLCNMQSNVLNDLAKAKRRWTEKKNIWVSSPLWIQDILDKEDQQTIAVIFHCNHRIHVHFNPGECCVTYWNGVVLPPTYG